MEIWADILGALPKGAGFDAAALPTRVQSATGVPHNRFWAHVREMQARGLVTGPPLAVTPLGREFLQQAEDVARFLQRFRMEHANGPASAVHVASVVAEVSARDAAAESEGMSEETVAP